MKWFFAIIVGLIMVVSFIAMMVLTFNGADVEDPVKDRMKAYRDCMYQVASFSNETEIQAMMQCQKLFGYQESMGL